MDRRGAGLLLHITSLPSPYGIGDLGPCAYRFADFLSETKQRYWQVLPLNPIDSAYGHSPYSSVSAFAGNTLLISPDLLAEEGLLERGEIEPKPLFPEVRCDYPRVISYKQDLFEQAYRRFRSKIGSHDEFQSFCLRHRGWLDDFCLFVVLKRRFQGRSWTGWPKEFRDRSPGSLQAIRRDCQDEVERERFLQWLLFKQWGALKNFCHDKGIRFIGDLPIYVSLDSADLWTNANLFKLDEEKRPVFVSGVPPDYFSKTGQRWGNPVYRWDALKESKFEWWVRRMRHQLDLFDVVRIDHFRGLVACWEIPAGEKTAVNGQWVDVPAEDFFGVLLRHFPSSSMIAEDLGLITSDVREVLDHLGFPGMKVLLFAFGSDDPKHPYLPHNYERNCVVYTGTHDNNTVRGWLEQEASPEDRRRLLRYIGKDVPAEQLSWEMIRLAMSSVANTAIVPVQDILGLGEKGRMNTPSTTHGNWEWRFSPDDLTPAVKQRLLEMTATYGRA